MWWGCEQKQSPRPVVGFAATHLVGEPFFFIVLLSLACVSSVFLAFCHDGARQGRMALCASSASPWEIHSLAFSWLELAA